MWIILWVLIASLSITGAVTWRRGLSVRRVAAGLCIAAATAIGSFGFPLAWMYRDGMGPGMRSTGGIDAVRSFSHLGIFVAVPIIVLAVVGMLLLRESRAVPPRSSQDTRLR
ncbi:MAG: hypothetical protein JWM27_791 [Gemmatimonadetes bacterium]|nr:hypothetical protein [Gemmatimonadota bacterium]